MLAKFEIVAPPLVTYTAKKVVIQLHVKGPRVKKCLQYFMKFYVILHTEICNPSVWETFLTKMSSLYWLLSFPLFNGLIAVLAKALTYSFKLGSNPEGLKQTF